MLFALPGIALMTLLVFSVYRAELENQVEVVRSLQRSALGEAERIIGDHLRRALQDFNYLAHGEQLLDFVAGGGLEAKVSLQREFKLFIDSHLDTYHQLRYIDRRGMEVVRINGGDEEAVVVPSHRLRDKSDRYYFKQSRTFVPHEIHLSTFDLNVEGDMVEFPYKPVIRLITRVPGGQDAESGILVLNYLGKPLLERLGKLAQGEGMHFWFLNEEGYWLMSDRPEDEWGFMFDDRRERRLPRLDPDLWQAVSGNPETVPLEVQHQDGLLSVHHLLPDQILANGEPGTSTASGPRWSLVAWMPGDRFDARTANSRRVFAIAWILATLVILVLSLLVASLVNAQLRASRAETMRVRKEQEDQCRSLLEAAPDGIAISDKDGRIVEVNHQLEVLFGYGRSEIIGQPLELLVPDRVRQRHSTYRRDYLADPAPRPMNSTVEVSGRRKDGSEFPVAVSLNTLTSSSGTLVIGSVRDVSESRAAQHALQDAVSRAEAANREYIRLNGELEESRNTAERLSRIKSEFLGNMSHEIRTPMNAVLGLSYMLKQQQLPEPAAGLVDRIHSSGEALLGILNSILDFSKIEAGRLEIERSPFYLGDVMDHLAIAMAGVVDGKDLELSISPPPPECCYLVGDSLRLRQVLINLASNAIKFTETGVVSVDVEVVDRTRDATTLCFRVRDTGIGMDAETLSRVATPFTQADASTGRRFGGTGLGLSISRRLVELLGGVMEIDSTPGKGSVFSFALTFDRQRQTESGPGKLAGFRVLVADDHPVARAGVGATVRAIGLEPELFERGEQLLERVLADSSLHAPRTVLLLDRRMPDIDGDRIVDALRGRLEPEARPIMLLLDTHASGYHAIAASDGAFDAVLDKPLGPSMLHQTILNAYRRRDGSGSPDSEKSVSTRRLEGLRILAVDDSEINLEVVQRVLAHHGARVESATSGPRALDRLTADPASVDLVLMDIHMPEMDGLQTTRRIRAIPALAGLPVIALTASALIEDREAAAAAGMDGFIAKPLEVEQAVAVITEAVGPVAGNPVGDSAMPIEADQPDTPTPQVLNEDYALSLFQDQRVYARFLEKFVARYRPELERLADPARDREELAGMLHKLRGAAGSLGLERVAAAVSTVETRLKAGDDPRQEARMLVESLECAFQAIADYAPAVGETAAEPATRDDGAVAGGVPGGAR